MPDPLPPMSVPDPEHARRAADSFRMLADATRVKILWALLQGESNVGGLAESVDTSPTTVSQHLAKLRLAGLVDSRRDGTFIYYSATSDHVRRLLAEALSHAEHSSGHTTGAHIHRYAVGDPPEPGPP